ncbi:hypothetical protein GCM10022383_24760 [Microbacterium soli]|uniref:HTH tetR-type domain-containing protein n=1 Tax=Microbacterium soli TaxID=446075 RepID=A0ABP7NGB4_9MICO
MPLVDLRLNDLARDAGVGVGTVYRHFPTVTALLEALHREPLEQLVESARRAAQSDDPASAFTDLIRAGTSAQLAHEGLQAVLTAPDASEEVSALREELHRCAAQALDAAIAHGQVRDELTVSSVLRLVCGIEHAVRLGDGEDRELLQDVLISGLLAPRP